MNTEQGYGIFELLDGAVLTKDGCLTVVYELTTPEFYTLSEEDIEQYQSSFFRAFAHIKKGIVHRQDIYRRKQFSYSSELGDSFLNKAEDCYFSGREYIEHRTILAFTLPSVVGLEASYIANPLKYKDQLSKAQKEQVSIFLESVETAVSILSNQKGVSVRELAREELYHWLFTLSNGLYDDGGIRDIHFSERLHIGEKEGILFALCHENYLPDKINYPTKDTTLPKGGNGLYMSVLEELGVHLPYNHIVNQIWRFDGRKYYEDLKLRVKNFGRHREFDHEIKRKYEELENFQEEMRNDTLCRYHYNVLLLEEDSEALQRGIERTKEILRNADFNFYIPSHEGLYKLFLASIIGREALLEDGYSILIDLEASLALNAVYTAQKGDDEGIWFNDRIYQVPLKIDLWDQSKKRIPARNAIVVASTGGGKSVATLNIVQQYLEQGVKVIVVEFGKSFYQLCQLYPEKSLHIDYNGTEPLGINPFYVPDGKPDRDKIKTLVNLILVFWRNEAILKDTAQVVSLTKIVEDYYNTVRHGHSFPSFYNYVEQAGERLYEVLDIQREYFDLLSFLHNCKQFTAGGFYENVCKESTLENDILNKDFVVFELTQIKKDPFLVSVIMSILFDTIESKILSDRSVRGMLVFDEYAEAQAIKDKHSGTDIHSTVAFCYQKLRKENGAIMTVIQSPAQLPDNEYTQGIISNTQLLFVLPTNDVVYDQTIERFHLKSEAQITLMKSGKNDFSGKRPYSELYIGFIPNYATVVRLELSPEKFLAFQTDGEIWNDLQKRVSNGATLQDSIIAVKK